MRRWLVRIPALVAAAVATPIAVACIAAIVGWPGRTFPGFFLLPNVVVPTAGIGTWTGIAAGVPFLSRLTAVDGQAVVDSAQAYGLVEERPVGTAFRYTIAHAGRVFDLIVPTMRFGWTDWFLTVGLMALFGVVSITAGVVVALLQPRTAAARAFLLFGVVTGLFGLTGSALYRPSGWAFLELHILTQAMFPATFFHLGLVFPVPQRIVERRPGVVVLPYVVGLVLAFWLLRDFTKTPPDLAAVYATFLFSAAGIVGLLGLFVHAYRENRTPAVRLQLRSVLPGFVVGTLVGLYGFLDNTFGGAGFPLNLVALTPPITFLSVAYAIVRHDLFDIDALLQRAFVYVLLTAGVTLAYVVSVALAAHLRPTWEPAGSPLFTITFVVLTALLLQPVRDLVQGGLDRLFWRGRLDYRRTVSRLSAALTSLLDLDEIVDRVGRTVSEGLQLETMTVLVFGPGDGTQRRDFPARVGSGTAGSFEAIRRRLAGDPEHPWTPGWRPDGDGRAEVEAAALGVVLVVPLSLGGELLGAFALGRPRSGRVFGRDDVELLRTLAAQTAIAVGNARSYRGLQHANADLEQKVEARTAALAQSHAELAGAYEALKATQTQLVHQEKMASLGVLVAGVAHEINNPVSFIVGGVEPLREVVADLHRFAGEHPEAELGPAVARAGRAVEAIARGAGRTAEVVKDLRTFSRLGDSRPRPVDVHDGIEVTLRLLESRLGGDIAVVREYATLPPVEGAPDELNQVWMNMLANACDAFGERGTIVLRTSADADEVRVCVRDDGSGIAPHVLPRIFDPFFTTKGQREGTGLGLAIAHGIVGRHGGRIEVQSRVGEGSEFTIVLPVRRRAGSSA